MIKYDNQFDYFEDDQKSRVFEIYPPTFNDNRGSFTEVMKYTPASGSWVMNLDWIKQINRSTSCAGTVRGCHAQKGTFCQGKLVSALNEKIYDIITDARPKSKTFGKTYAYLLDSVKNNMLWVPRGFLHAFAVPECKGQAIFQYFCDNVYNKESETGANPATVIPEAVEILKSFSENNRFEELFKLFDSGKYEMSAKDTAAPTITEWLSQAKKLYDETGTVWYV